MVSTSDAPEVVSRLARDEGLAVAVSESLTSGALASALGAAPDAAEWFRGAIVAYAAVVKHGLLEVPPGPVVCREAVVAMALSTGELLDADVVLAVSGVGGPGPQDDVPAGTVCFAVSTPWHVESEEQRFEGDPAAVLAQTVDHGLAMLVRALAGVAPVARTGTADDADPARSWGGIVRPRSGHEH
jgi:nicotinamide-nucleotide amidase